MTNAERAARASALIYFYGSMTNQSHEDPGTNIQDMIADLMHYTSAEDLNLDHLIDMGRMHYESEIEDGEADEYEGEEDSDVEA